MNKDLAIYQVRGELLAEISKSRALIVVGEAGSGKTTQIPQYLYLNDYARGGKLIGVTQPRRVSAMAVSRRVSDELHSRLGALVGYSVRFDSCVSNSTKIKFVTDGMLLREAISDPLFSKYSVIILDEAHERTVNTDILFGLVKRALNGQRKDDLKVIVMSATLDAEVFSHHFWNCNVCYVEGRQYPVSVMYTKTPIPDYLDAMVTTILQIHFNYEPGDILCFLSGQEEIEMVERVLKSKNEVMKDLVDSGEVSGIHVLKLFAALPSEKQMKVFEPAPKNCRKVILSTNIAETAVTIEGIRYVVDTGVVKLKKYSPRKGMESLVLVSASKSQSTQRAGRAGRTSSGLCFRLYTEESFEEMENVVVPEIQRSNLLSIVLLLKTMNIENVVDFDFVDPPPKQLLKSAVEELKYLKILSANKNEVLPIGRQLVDFPLDPTMSLAIVKSGKHRCTEQVVTIISMLSVENIFFSPGEKQEKAKKSRQSLSSNRGDHLTLLNIYRGFSKMKGEKKWCNEMFLNRRSLFFAKKVRDQLMAICRREGMDLVASLSKQEEEEAVLKSLLEGLFLNVAMKRKDGSLYSLLRNSKVKIHPSSVLFGRDLDCVMCSEFVKTTHDYVRQASIVKPEWVAEVAPHVFSV